MKLPVCFPLRQTCEQMHLYNNIDKRIRMFVWILRAHVCQETGLVPILPVGVWHSARHKLSGQGLFLGLCRTTFSALVLTGCLRRPSQIAISLRIGSIRVAL